VVLEIAAQVQLRQVKPARRRVPATTTRLPAGERHACREGAAHTLCGLNIRASGFQRFPGPWEGASSWKSCPQCVTAERKLAEPDEVIDLTTPSRQRRRVTQG